MNSNLEHWIRAREQRLNGELATIAERRERFEMLCLLLFGQLTSSTLNALRRPVC